MTRVEQLRAQFDQFRREQDVISRALANVGLSRGYCDHVWDVQMDKGTWTCQWCGVTIQTAEIKNS